MIAAALLLATPAAFSPGPILDFAQAPSAEYRDCVKADRVRRGGNRTVTEIGRAGCARARSKLRSAVWKQVAFRWSAIGVTRSENEKIRAQIDRSAADIVGAFEQELQAWLETAPREGRIPNAQS